MLDATLPVAKRTRLREAQAYKEYYEKKKEEERRRINGVVGESTSSLRVGGVKGGKSVQVCENGNGLRNLRLDSGFISDDDVFVDDDDDDDDDGDDGGVECIGEDGLEREGGGCFDFEGLEALGVKSKGKEKVGFEGIDDRVEIVNVDSEDDVVCLAEGSDVGVKKAEDFVCIDVDNYDGGLSDEELGESDGREKNGGVEVLEDETVNVSDFGDWKSSGLEDREDCSGDEISVEDSDESETESSEEDNDDSDDEDFGVEESENSEEEGESENSSSSGEESEVTERGRSEGEKRKGSRVEVGVKGKKASDILIDSNNDKCDNDNEDFGVEESDNSEEKVKESEATESGRSEREKGSRVEVGVKRKKAYGLDILVDLNNDKGDDNDNCVNGSPCVAKRTRSRFNSESGEKKMKHGTVSLPLCVDEEELKSLPGHDDNVDDGDDNEVFDNVREEARFNNGKIGSKGGNDENEGELRKSTKRKRIRAPKNDDFLKILADSILDKGEVPLEDEALKEERCQPVTEIALPLKFTFGVEEQTPPEKSEYEKELDKLWVELDFALISSEMGSTDPAMRENEDNVSPEVELDAATLCRQGNHQLMLDEQIGIRCRLCSYVELEIRHVVPPFCTDPRGKSDRKDYGRVEQSIFDELQNQDFCSDSQSGNDPAAHGQGTVWDIIPGIKNSMYLHQREGFEFIWSIIAGGIYLDKLKDPTNSHRGSGCVISHAPGTGKTRLIIVFLQTYMELFPTCRPVVVAPRSMLLTWEEEFRKWKVDIPFHILNKTELSNKENKAAVSFLKRVKLGERNANSIRMVKLYSWKKEKSILGISYRLFEELVGEDKSKARSKARRKTGDEQVRKILHELPGLFVFDEGHTARNDQTLMWKALSKINTKKRIILSGTPFQNNFDELFNTLSLVRPEFTEKISDRNIGGLDKKRGRKRNEAKGKWSSLTSPIGKVTDDNLKSARIKELRAEIAPFVHVHKGNILQQSLPGLRRSVVVLQPTPVQKSLLEGVQGRNMIMLDYYVSSVSIHPSLLPKHSFEKEESFVDMAKLEGLRLNPEAGVKTKFLMELLRLSEAINEKVLVFGQYIRPLKCIRDQLKSHFNWTEGNEVLYMDGKCDSKLRQSSINVFNNPTSKTRVMLASTKACNEGISLVGASRVVLLDVVWNPSVERQAISRAYRIGQKKVVYIYHLITSGTMEEEKFCRQAEKERMSELLFSASNNSGNQQKITSTVSEDKILEEMIQHEKLKNMFRKIISKESDLIEALGLVDL